MDELDFQKLKDLSSNIRKLNSKIKLLGLLEKAKQEYDSNCFSETISTCEKILEVDLENTAALRGIGCALQAQDDFLGAIKYYKKALKFSKSKEVEYTLIGNVYYNDNQLEKAIKYFNLAIESNDNCDDAYEGRNQSMLEQHLAILDLQDELITRKIF